MKLCARNSQAVVDVQMNIGNRTGRVLAGLKRFVFLDRQLTLTVEAGTDEPLTTRLRPFAFA